MSDDTLVLTDHQGRVIRFTAERRDHVLSHPEMETQLERVRETLESPQVVIATAADTSVHVYHRYYDKTPVTSKYLLVAVKIEAADAFVPTAFFSSRQKRGSIVWPA